MSNNITKFLNSRVIELSSQKIELGIVDDLSLDADSIDAGVKRSIGDYLDLKRQLDKVKSEVSTYKSRISDAEKKLKEIQSTTKILGIDEPPKVSSARKTLQDATKVYEKLTKDLNTI